MEKYDYIEKFSLSDRLLRPPRKFSSEAAEAWREEVDSGVTYLTGPGIYVAGLEGPNHAFLDYDRKKKLLLLTLSNDSGEALLTLNAETLERHVERDCLTLLTNDAKISFMQQAASPNVMDALNKAQAYAHIEGVEFLMEGFSKQNEHTVVTKSKFCKELFALLRIIIPTDPLVEKELGKLYEPRLR